MNAREWEGMNYVAGRWSNEWKRFIWIISWGVDRPLRDAPLNKVALTFHALLTKKWSQRSKGLQIEMNGPPVDGCVLFDLNDVLMFRLFW